MKILFLGKELDSSIEQDLNSDASSPFGFKVTIVYNDQWADRKQCPHLTRTRNNVTQVHNRWGIDDEIGEERIAFESDIHSTGGWQYIHDIVSVTIERAEKKEDEHMPSVEVNY